MSHTGENARKQRVMNIQETLWLVAMMALIGGIALFAIIDSTPHEELGRGIIGVQIAIMRDIFKSTPQLLTIAFLVGLGLRWWLGRPNARKEKS